MLFKSKAKHYNFFNCFDKNQICFPIWIKYKSDFPSAPLLVVLNSLEQFDGLTAEAGQSCIQHQRYQGNHSIHIRPAEYQRFIHSNSLSVSNARTHTHTHTHTRTHAHVSPDGQVSAHTHLHEPLEGRGLHLPTHDHHHLIGQFDVRLPAQIPPGELSNMKPKSETHTHIRNTQDERRTEVYR